MNQEQLLGQSSETQLLALYLIQLTTLHRHTPKMMYFIYVKKTLKIKYLFYNASCNYAFCLHDP